MKYLGHELARLSLQQWLTLISLLVVLNMVVMGGIVWLIASDIAPEALSIKQVILAQAPFTRTPQPTFTPIPSTATAPTSTLPPSPTNTGVPTWTPSITPTPLPTFTFTPTPIPPPTRPFQRALAQVRILATPIPAPTSTPNVDFWATVRQLTACENQGKHHIFVYVVDGQGNGLPNQQVKISWVGGEAVLTTGTKRDHPGLADFAMFKGNYFAEMLNASSNRVGPISPNIPRNETCAENNNPEANSLYHYSFVVMFKKMR